MIPPSCRHDPIFQPIWARARSYGSFCCGNLRFGAFDFSPLPFEDSLLVPDAGAGAGAGGAGAGGAGVGAGGTGAGTDTSSGSAVVCSSG